MTIVHNILNGGTEVRKSANIILGDFDGFTSASIEVELAVAA